MLVLQVGVDPAAVGAVTGVEADVVLAAYYAAEVAAKTIKAGNTNTQVSNQPFVFRNFMRVCVLWCEYLCAAVVLGTGGRARIRSLACTCILRCCCCESVVQDRL